MMLHFSKFITPAIVAAGFLLTAACETRQSVPQMEGHYTYAHAFDYDFQGNHFDVQETGTMDFHADGTARDSARQVYAVHFADGDTATWVFNYISPSRWHLNADTLHFAGIKDGFRMQLVEGNDHNTGLALQIIDLYGSSIDREQQFHLDTLTAVKMQWSLTYRDGQSDTWLFIRNDKAKKD